MDGRIKFYLLNEEIKCYFIVDLYFHLGQRKSYSDTIPQVGREIMIFGKPGKKVKLYNKFSVYFFLISRNRKKTPNKKTTLKIHCQWSGDYPEKKAFLNRFFRDWI